jgi:hypothetical protein
LASSAVVDAGADSWPEGLAAVLQKLGCFVLDTAGFELPLEALLQHCVHRPSGTGVAAAICAALGWGGSVAAGQELNRQQELAAEAVADRLTVDDARIMGSLLLQQRWFGGTAGAGSDAGMRALLLVVKQLPLYELANSKSMQQEATAAGAQQGSEQGREPEHAQQEKVKHSTVALSPGCCLAPAGKR